MEFKWTKVHCGGNDWLREAYIDFTNDCRIDRNGMGWEARFHPQPHHNGIYFATIEAFKTKEEAEAWLTEWIPRVQALLPGTV